MSAAPAPARIGFDASCGEGGALLGLAVRGLSEPVALPLARATPETLAALRSGTRCTAALPAAAALLVPLAAPPLPPAKLRRVLPALLAAKLPFALSDCAWTFEEPRGGRVLAHVARRADAAARLDELATLGCDPLRLVPPAPAAWRLACARKPLPEDAPRAVFLAGEKETLLAAGRGSALESVASFPADPAAAPRRLRLAFGGLPAGLSVLVAGPAAARVAAALAPDVRADIPAEPEAFLARALASRGADGLDLRGAFRPPPAAGRGARRRLAAAAAAFFACSAVAAGAGLRDWRLAAAERDALLEERSFALDELAGRHVSAKGSAAVAEARRAAAERRDDAPLAPSVSPAPPDVLRAAAAHGVLLSHLDLSRAGLSASGTAPDAAAADAFLADVRAAGVRTTLDEPPKPSDGGRVSFFSVAR